MHRRILDILSRLALIPALGAPIAAPGCSDGSAGSAGSATQTGESGDTSTSAGGLSMSSTSTATTSTTTGGSTSTAETEASTGAASTTEAPPVCGDGEVDAGEACDDGNDLDGDACTNGCAEARCGDGIVHDGAEACDDGNRDETDGCSSACEIVPSCSGGFCAATAESCPPSAQVNAEVQGVTPLGPFTGTFAAFYGAIAFGELGEMEILPAYDEGDLCAARPRLSLALGSIGGYPTYSVDAPARLYDGEGGWVDAIAQVTVHECCKFLWFCDCHNSDPFWIEVVIEGDGWSLSGTAAPNCCRSYSIDEAAAPAPAPGGRGRRVADAERR